MGIINEVMGNINKEGIEQAKKLRKKRTDDLLELISTPFDPSQPLDENQNPVETKQQLKLKKYIDEFELSVNKMYIYQAVSKGITLWGGSWLINRFLPVPEMLNSLFAVFLYFGIAAAVVKSFSMTDFLVQQQEMEKIYNWCLKDNKVKYSDKTDNSNNSDNSDKLKLPQIQRLIKLLAPLCDSEFMIAWPNEIPSSKDTSKEDKSGWGKTIDAGYTALRATFSIFSPSPTSQLTLEQQRLKELKIKVEKEELNLNTFTALEQAVRYFGHLAANTDYKAFLASKLKQPLATLQDTASTVVQESFHPKRP
ncbi:hypothetical protein [Legionella sp. km772]|uniref:hypothetical protein n=1 Tax=Legionella sp. km772 TaxID=2498111 RepID=UPI000F8DA09A|nr:hypothetical protein [Legionella sp. km772]RUR12208.1 hypothetical protein ELY15_05775 [Legionella sp. km772]